MIERRGHLEGAWRRERTEDPRDHTWVSAALLFIGPPTHWGR